MNEVSVERILETYVEDYLSETEAPFTKEEVFNSVQKLLPVYKDGIIIGMLGADVFPSQKLQEPVPVLRIIYIAPQHRKPNSFKTLVTDVMQSLKSEGYKRVEIQMNHKLNNWFKREMHSKPRQYTHLQTIDFYLDQLVDKGE